MIATQKDAIETIGSYPRRVVALLWAMRALFAMTGASAATYRALAVMLGTKDRKNLKAIVREAVSRELVRVDRTNPRLAAVRITNKAKWITDILVRAVPESEIEIMFRRKDTTNV